MALAVPLLCQFLLCFLAFPVGPVEKQLEPTAPETCCFLLRIQNKPPSPSLEKQNIPKSIKKLKEPSLVAHS